MGQSKALADELAVATGDRLTMRRVILQAARRAIRGIRPSAGALLLLAGCAAPEPGTWSLPASYAPVPAPATGAQRDAPAEPLTVERAVERGETLNPQLKALSAAVEVAKKRKSAASDFEDPEVLAAWGDIGDEFTDGGRPGEKEWRTGARFYLPNPFLIGPRVSARTAEILASKADLQAATWQVECDIRRLFAEINYLTEDLALAADLVRQDSEILKDVRSRAQQGAATASEVVAAAQKQLQTQNDLDQTRHRYQVAQRDLAALLDTPAASLQIVTNALTNSFLPAMTLRLDLLQRVAIRSRGDVAALHWRTLAAGSAYREARNVRIPWFKEVTAWNREPADQWWVGLGITVPLFSWTKNHADEVLQAQARLAGVNETNGVQLAYREIRDAVDELEEREGEQKRNQSEVVPTITEMRQTLQLLKGTPNVMASQVATTEAQVLEASRLELAARWRYHLALLNLERALGEPLSEALEALRKKT